MATRYNTSALLVVARIIPTPEGYVYRITHTITGTGDLQEVARDFAGPSTIPVLAPLRGDPLTAATRKSDGYRDAYHQARRRLDRMVAKLNRIDYGI